MALLLYKSPLTFTTTRRLIFLIAITCLSVLFLTIKVGAQQEKCGPGYHWEPQSGVGCVQTNCNDVPGAHLGYTSNCVCGSAGSLWENPEDANTPCMRSSTDPSCPSCVYACVHKDESCPEDKPSDPSSVPTCTNECQKLIRGSAASKVLEGSGKHPNCHCLADIRDEGGRLTQTITQDGDKRTILSFDPNSGELISRNVLSIQEERERIRRRLGFRYTADQIDDLTGDERINDWFDSQTESIETNTSLLRPSFWWQHILALLDHGFGDDPEFVETYHFGRCGDSMKWLESKLVGELGLNGDEGVRQEAMLSITGEKYGNMINHTALLIRPQGVENEDWAEIIQLLVKKSGEGGLNRADLSGVDPKILSAKVLDPYYKKVTTVEDFIKGWSVIRIS